MSISSTAPAAAPSSHAKRGSAGPAVVAAATAADVPSLIALMNLLAAERNGLFIMPVDPVSGVAMLQAHLAAIAGNGNEAVLIAANGGEIYALATGTRGVHPARRGTLDIGIGVHPARRGEGLGTALMRAMERWAASVGIHRLQLTVLTTNAPAISLYRKVGFAIEGVLRARAECNGSMLDEYIMVKLIEPQAPARPTADTGR
ncbi:MAG TPA: GNAT family N-acetyltransferase [Stellaceae bacterium]|nr:GNAT family N-acetyltransferase [Stellaceae bacterium]